MNRTKTASPIVALLARLTRIDGVAAAALTTAEGLPIAASGRVAANELVDLRSATTAAIFGAVNRALPGLGLGSVHAATIETSTYTVYMRGLDDLVLSAVVDRSVDSTVIVRELDRVVDVLSWVRRTTKGS